MQQSLPEVRGKLLHSGIPRIWIAEHKIDKMKNTETKSNRLRQPTCILFSSPCGDAEEDADAADGDDDDAETAAAIEAAGATAGGREGGVSSSASFCAGSAKFWKIVR